MHNSHTCYIICLITKKAWLLLYVHKGETHKTYWSVWAIEQTSTVLCERKGETHSTCRSKGETHITTNLLTEKINPTHKEFFQSDWFIFSKHWL